MVAPIIIASVRCSAIGRTQIGSPVALDSHPSVQLMIYMGLVRLPKQQRGVGRRGGTGAGTSLGKGGGAPSGADGAAESGFMREKTGRRSLL